MALVIHQYDVLLINLEPAVSAVLLSPDEMNVHIESIIVAPLTPAHAGVEYPTRVPFAFNGKPGWIVLDQIRTVQKNRVVRKLGFLGEETVKEVKRILSAMLVE
jgi:mRNA interferase MazF